MRFIAVTVIVISIHALREESDDNTIRHIDFVDVISIHALREESDITRVSAYGYPYPFQSTLSVRRATGNRQTMQLADIFQSTLSVRRATDDTAIVFPNPAISIHALREESDRYSHRPV